MNKKRILLITCIFGIGLILMSCAGMPTKPTEANFKAPGLPLNQSKSPNITGFGTTMRRSPL